MPTTPEDDQHQPPQSFTQRVWHLAWEHPWRTLVTSAVIYVGGTLVATALQYLRRAIGL